MRKYIARTALAVSVVALAAGCGGGLKDVFQPGSAPATTGKPALTMAEKALQRLGLMQVEEICVECWVTGGGAGNLIACGGAKFGLVAQDTDGLTGDAGKGHLQFQLEIPSDDYNIGGKVDRLRCLEIYEGSNGDTWGKCEFYGTLSKEQGLQANKTWTFHVIVEDYGEPNKDDHLTINVFDEGGVSATGFPWSCDTEDGNIQLHPTRAEQL